MKCRMFIAVLACLAAIPNLAEAQNWQAEPTYGKVDLKAGFLPDPHLVRLTAGGSIGVNMGECDYGNVANAPDIDINYQASGSTNLYFYVESNDDTILLINTPAGQWVCNDDGHSGTNPLIRIPNAPSGLYDVWVGTYSTEMVSALLHISEMSPGNDLR